MRTDFIPVLIAATMVPALFGQAAPARTLAPPEPAPQQQQQQPPPPANAAAPAGQPQAGTSPVATAPAQSRLTDTGGFLLNNVSLTEMIDILAKRMKINYLLDPGVKGSVSIYTYGEVKPIDLMPLMETILRVNGAAMVQVGDLYRIVPIKTVSQLPIDPVSNVDPKTLPEDERMILNLIFLKYVTAGEIEKLIQPFLGEGATISVYDPANLLVIEDNSRSMKRTMGLIALFDSDTFAGQRVRLFDITHSRPTDLVKELDSVFKAYALSEKSSPVKFIAVDRINTVIAVAPNPGVFTEVKDWIAKLDIPVKIRAGAVRSYVYRLRYGRAETVAMAIMALYTGNVGALMSLSAQMNSGMVAAGMGYNGTGYGGGFGGGGYGGGGYGGGGYGGGYGGGGYGGGYGGGGYGGGGGGGYGGGGYGGGGYGGGGYGAMNYGGMGYGGGGYGGGGYGVPLNTAVGAAGVPSPTGGANTTAGPSDLTGSYLGTAGGQAGTSRIPHVIPNPFDNTLLIQGTPEDYEQIQDLLRQLDVAPRQVLIDAKIYEVDLTGNFEAGVESFLEKKNTGTVSTGRTLTASGGSAGLALSVGALVLHSHELLGVLTASENRTRTRVISAPSIMATDSIPATMNVGDQVPVATSQGLGGITVGGTSAVVNGISSQSTGVTLSITPYVNSSGIVTMIINQQVSAPEPPPIGVNTAVQSSSFSNRSVSTQLTVQDGDTVAIGGAILEHRGESSGGIPLLHRIPWLGAAFGAKSYQTSRTELIIFLTPRVIYDTNQVVEATDEIRGNLKLLQKSMRGMQ